MRIVILLGPPGSGKGTLAQRCMQDGFLIIGAGDLLRARAAMDDQFGLELRSTLNSGKMVDNAVILQIICDKLNDFEQLNAHDGVLLDGFPRNLEQMKIFHQYLLSKSTDKMCQLLVFAINADDQLMRDRISSRFVCVAKECGKINGHVDKCGFCGGAVVKRKDDLADSAVALRLSIYHQSIEPLKAFFVERGISICNFNLTEETTPDVVFKAFEKFFLSAGSCK